MTDQENSEKWNSYRGELVKTIHSKRGSFYGVLQDLHKNSFTLFPYLSFKTQSDGGDYPVWVEEGKPFELSNEEFCGIHPIDKKEIEAIILAHENGAKSHARRLRIEEIESTLHLEEMEKVYKQKQEKK